MTIKGKKNVKISKEEIQVKEVNLEESMSKEWRTIKDHLCQNVNTYTSKRNTSQHSLCTDVFYIKR